MADITPNQLTEQTSVASADLVMVYPTGGPLKKITWLNTVAQIVTDLTPSFLKRDQNLADLNSVGVARTNLGLGSVATLNTGTSSGNIALLGTGGKTPISTLPGGYFTNSANYTILAADNGKLLDVTANSPTITLPTASTVGETFFIEIRNSGAGTVTVSPASGTVDGGSSTVVGPGATRSFFNDASNYFSVGASAAPGIIHVQLQRPNNNNSGENVPAATWGKRELNTVLINTIPGASLASDQITLPAGTYKVSAVSPSYSSGEQAIRARIYDATAAAALVSGPNSAARYDTGTGSPYPFQSWLNPTVQGYFTLTAAHTVELQTHSISPVGSYDKRVNSGDPEIYNDVLIERVG